MAEPSTVTVNKHSGSPQKALNLMQDHQVVEKLAPLPLDTPIFPDKVRFVCMSDTHTKAAAFRDQIPDGDVFLHAGDFTYKGMVLETLDFNEFLGTLQHRHKFVIAGNHELTFDDKILPMSGPLSDAHLGRQKLEDCRGYLKRNNLNNMSQLLTNCHYLLDSEVTVYGLRIYGAPWQPTFHSWAFNVNRGKDILEKWNKIPNDVDVLITHGPPLGRGDVCLHGQREGCVELLSTIQNRVRPKFHIFGHIHEGRDITFNEDEGYSSDGVTTYINASNLDKSYKPVYPPIIFDIPLPNGVHK